MIFIEYSEDICDFATLLLVSLIHFSEPVHTAISLNQFKTLIQRFACVFLILNSYIKKHFHALI